MKTLEKDILLICKGWYNHEKYDILKAFNAYYHKEYGCEDIEMDKEFAINLFLKPLFLNLIPYKLQSIFECSYLEYLPDYDNSFVNTLFNRLIKMAIETDYKIANIDLSDYEDMLNKAKESDNRDHIIGIV